MKCFSWAAAMNGKIRRLKDLIEYKRLYCIYEEQARASQSINTSSSCAFYKYKITSCTPKHFFWQSSRVSGLPSPLLNEPNNRYWTTTPNHPLGESLQ